MCLHNAVRFFRVHVSTINQAIAVVIARVFEMDELTAFQQSAACAKLRAVVEEYQNASTAVCCRNHYADM